MPCWSFISWIHLNSFGLGVPGNKLNKIENLRIYKVKDIYWNQLIVFVSENDDGNTNKKSCGIRVGNKSITLLIMNRLPWIDECQRVCSVLVGLPEMFFAKNPASNLNGSGHNDKNKPEEDSHHTFMQHTFTTVTSKALSIDVMENRWYRSRPISSCVGSVDSM